MSQWTPSKRTALLQAFDSMRQSHEAEQTSANHDVEMQHHDPMEDVDPQLSNHFSLTPSGSDAYPMEEDDEEEEEDDDESMDPDYIAPPRRSQKRKQASSVEPTSKKRKLAPQENEEKQQADAPDTNRRKRKIVQLMTTTRPFRASDVMDDYGTDRMAPLQALGVVGHEFKKRRLAAQEAEQKQDEDEESEESYRERLRAQFENVLPMPPDPTLHLEALRQLQDVNLEAWKARLMQRRIRRREDVIMQPLTTRYCIGDKRLAKLRWCLNNMGMKCSVDQQYFMEHFTQAILPLIYAEDWDNVAQRVMREFKITEIKSEVLCMTPRRFGKTFAIAMFVAALLMSVPDMKVAVFSPGQRASSSMMKLVIKFINQIPGGSNRIIGSNKEKLYVSEKELPANIGTRSEYAKNLLTQDSTSELACYPSSKKGQYQTQNTQRV